MCDAENLALPSGASYTWEGGGEGLYEEEQSGIGGMRGGRGGEGSPIERCSRERELATSTRPFARKGTMGRVLLPTGLG